MVTIIIVTMLLLLLLFFLLWSKEGLFIIFTKLCWIKYFLTVGITQKASCKTLSVFLLLLIQCLIFYVYINCQLSKFLCTRNVLTKFSLINKTLRPMSLHIISDVNGVKTENWTPSGFHVFSLVNDLISQRSDIMIIANSN